MLKTEVSSKSKEKSTTKKALENQKALICDEALILKRKIDKLNEQLAEKKGMLLELFDEDPKPMFTQNGSVELKTSNSYSVKEEHISDAEKILKSHKLMFDDYITQKTSWGVTGKLRSLLADTGQISDELKHVVTINTSKAIVLKCS